MKKLTLSLLFVVLFHSMAYAAVEDIYYAQASSGTANGSSCANAMAISNITWSATDETAGSIDPGDTAHLCGTITTAFTVGASGTSSNSITILFEAGAKLSKGSWGSYGSALYSSGKDYIIVDGGTDGIIEATDNGTTLTNQEHNYGVRLLECNNCEVKNMTIRNLYVRTPNSSDSNGYGTGIQIDSSYDSVHDSSVVNANTGISFQFGTNSSISNINIYNNTIDRVSNGITGGSGGPNAVVDTMNIYNNSISNLYVWDGTWTGPPGDGHHHSDGIQVWANHTGSSTTNLRVYNNTIGSDMGGFVTAWIFLEGFHNGALIYNNILTSSNGSYPANGFITLGWNTSPEIYQNTIIGDGGGTGIGLGSTVVNATIKNNIFYNISTGIYVSNGGTIAQSDYNIFYSLGANQMRYDPGFYTFTKWQQATGFDAHSLTADPLLNTFYKPQSLDSPGVGAGTNLNATFQYDKSGINRSLQGTNWDIGAYEYTTIRPNPPPTVQ